MKLKSSIAVVTGASKGIGLAIVENLLERGVIVAGWGRTKPLISHKNFHFCNVDTREI